MSDARDHWNDVYTARPANRASWHQERPSFSLELIAGVVGPEASVLDVGGGASKLVDSLLAIGHTTLGVLDVSGVALQNVRERLGSDADRVEWFEEDVREFRDRCRWDVWHDRAVFHFLTEPDDRGGYFEALASAVKPGGHVILSTFALDGPDRCSGLTVEKYDSEKITNTFGPGYELLHTRNEKHVTPSGGEQRFVYNVLRRRE